MSDLSHSGPACPVEDPAALLLLEDQQARWRRGERMLVESYLSRLPHLHGDSEVALELILHEVLLRQERGESPALSEYQGRFPHLAGPLVFQFEVERAIDAASSTSLPRPRTTAATSSTMPPAASTITAADPPAALSSGRRIPGYEILSELGRGGMGVVYKARHLRLNRVVALKMVLSGGHATAEECLRFLAEAEAIAAVRHPGIVQVHDFGTHDGSPFFSLEYCPGGSLAAMLAGNPLAPRQTAALIEQVARAVQAAHDAGIIHRDLKPANVLLDERGQPRVTDFGLAKRTEVSDGLTRTGAVVGTPSYLAPEQAQGKKDVGRAADVHALGAILYECLTGRPPFKAATTFDTLLQVVHDEPVPPRQLCSAVPLDLETICLKCLNKEPARRYASAAALADDLRRWQAGEPIAARPAGLRERAVKWAGRRPAWAALLGVSLLAALALVGLSAVAVVQWQRAVTALTSEKKARQELESEHRMRAVAQVSALRDAAPGAVPAFLAGLKAMRSDVLPQLRQFWEEEQAPGRRLRVGLALLPVESEAVRDELAALMLKADDPAEVLLVRDALRPHQEALAANLWAVVSDARQDADRRFRAACALAGFAAPGTGRWQEVAPFVADHLLAAVHANPSHYKPLLDLLRPIRGELLAPLSRAFRGKERSESERSWATTVLADYAADRPDALAELLMGADVKQFGVIYPKLRLQGERGQAALAAELRRTPPPDQASPDRETLAKRQANAAVALLKMGRAGRVWPLLRHSPDPRVRSYLIHRLGPLGVHPRAIVKRLEEERDVSIRRALVLSLGELGEKELPLGEREEITATLKVLYRNEADPGLHAAAEWVLRTWKQEPWLKASNDDWAMDTQRRQGVLSGIEQSLLRETTSKPPRWYVDGQGHTMVVMPGPVQFLMGSPVSEVGRFDGEQLHLRRIGRTFAVASKPVTVEQFMRFRKDRAAIFSRHYAPSKDCPIHGTSWFDAAAYCNWLSGQEGIPPQEWCYETTPQGEVKQLRPKYLKLRGYRLPTEAEIEYTCRAGALTSRSYGESAELLGKYAWYLHNSDDRSWPVGTLKPNDLGMFDLHGNVWCWCQEQFKPYARVAQGAVLPDVEGDLTISTHSRVLRGGSFNRLDVVRCGNRYGAVPTYRGSYVGFRPARTLAGE
jgi:formylglycine-generating enzyme required for sulfatase activity/tRNA A-37 threonylcarbamoyl transferase component Bud32